MHEVLSVQGELQAILCNPVGFIKWWSLGRDGADIVPRGEFNLKEIRLVCFPESVWTPHSILVVKATGFWSEGVERLLPWWRINVVIRDLCVLHPYWMTAARDTWKKYNWWCATNLLRRRQQWRNVQMPDDEQKKQIKQTLLLVSFNMAATSSRENHLLLVTEINCFII